jgi:hypothetical protein
MDKLRFVQLEEVGEWMKVAKLREIGTLKKFNNW